MVGAEPSLLAGGAASGRAEAIYEKLGLLALLEGAKERLGPALAGALETCKAKAEQALLAAETAGGVEKLDPLVLFLARRAVEADVGVGVVATLGAGPRAEAALEKLEKRAVEMRQNAEGTIVHFAARHLGASLAVTPAGTPPTPPPRSFQVVSRLPPVYGARQGRHAER